VLNIEQSGLSVVHAVKSEKLRAFRWLALKATSPGKPPPGEVMAGLRHWGLKIEAGQFCCSMKNEVSR
jgi:hypothetical protein